MSLATCLSASFRFTKENYQQNLKTLKLSDLDLTQRFSKLKKNGVNFPAA